MGLLDKLLGRGKQAAGDVMGSTALKHEGAHQEAEGNAAESAATHEALAQADRERAAEHHAEREAGS